MRKLIVLSVLILFLTPTSAFAADVVEDTSAPTEMSDVVSDVPDPSDPSDTTAEEADIVEEEVVEEPIVEDPKQPETTEEAKETVNLIVKAFQMGAWPIGVGLIIMLLVWVANRFGLKEKVGEKWVPWIAAGLGILSTVGIALATGSLVWWQALIQGFLSGASATGFWELVFKHIPSAKKEEE